MEQTKSKLERRYYNAKDMCEYLGINRYTLQTWRNLENNIPYVMINEHPYFDKDEVDKWMHKRDDGKEQIRKWVSNNPETYSELTTACKRESAFDREVNWIEIVSKVKSDGAKIPVRYVDGLKALVEKEHPEIKFKSKEE